MINPAEASRTRAPPAQGNASATLRRTARPRDQALPAQARPALRQIDTIDASIAQIDLEVDAEFAPFRGAVRLLSTIPGVGDLVKNTCNLKS